MTYQKYACEALLEGGGKKAGRNSQVTSSSWRVPANGRPTLTGAAEPEQAVVGECSSRSSLGGSHDTFRPLATNQVPRLVRPDVAGTPATALPLSEPRVDEHPIAVEGGRGGHPYGGGGSVRVLLPTES